MGARVCELMPVNVPFVGDYYLEIDYGLVADSDGGCLRIANSKQLNK